MVMYSKSKSIYSYNGQCMAQVYILSSHRAISMEFLVNFPLEITLITRALKGHNAQREV